MSDDLPDRLRAAATHALMDAARSTVLEAADEIERLLCLARFHERAMRNGVTAALSDEERAALRIVASVFPSEKYAATLRDLLERLT